MEHQPVSTVTYNSADATNTNLQNGLISYLGNNSIANYNGTASVPIRLRIKVTNGGTAVPIQDMLSQGVFALRVPQSGTLTVQAWIEVKADNSQFTYINSAITNPAGTSETVTTGNWYPLLPFYDNIYKNGATSIYTSFMYDMAGTAGITPSNTAGGAGFAMFTYGTGAAPSVTTNSPICAGTTLTLTGALNGISAACGNLVYSWTGPVGITSPSSLAATVPSTTTSATGTYNLTISSGYTSTTANVCFSKISTAVVVNPIPSATISGTTALCQNATAPNITFTGTGGTAPYTFTYNINGGTNTTVTSASGTNPVSVNVAAPTGTSGTFTYNLVSVNDATSTACSQTITGQSATVTVNASPTAPTINGQTGGTITAIAGCGTVTITATANGGDGCYFYKSSSLIPANRILATAGTSVTLSYPIAYSNVYVTSYNSVTGCEGTATTIVPVTITQAPTISVTTTDVSCYGGNTGSASATTGTGYSYAWSGTSSTTNPVTGLTAGNYTLTVTSGACQSIQNFTINQPAQLVASISTSTAPTCNATNNGTITATASGGTTPYTYSWSTGATSLTVSSLSASTSGTTYSFSVTDSKACTANTSVTLVGPTAVVNTAAIAYNCSSGFTTYQSATITLQGSGGTSPYTYSFAGTGGTFTSTNTITVSTNGTYSNYYVKDANGCVSSATSIVVSSIGTTVNTSTTCGIIYTDPNGSGTIGSRTCPMSFTQAITSANTGTFSGIILLKGSSSYAYNVTGPITIPSNVIIDGGYTVNGSGEWVKSTGTPTTMTITSAEESGGTNITHTRGLLCSGTGFTIQDINLTVNGPSGQINNFGKSVYGIYMNGASNYTINRVNVTTGNATKGSNGTAGAAGGGGSGGYSGNTAIDECGDDCYTNWVPAGDGVGYANGGAAGGNGSAGCAGGYGGDGGDQASDGNAYSGLSGACSTDGSQTAGSGGNGPGHTCSWCCCSGVSGGGNGTNATSWSSPASTGSAGGAGSVSGGYWLPGTQGSIGAGGYGGAGGGGGGGGAISGANDNTCYWRSGGCGGQGGGGGGGGGGGTGGYGGGSAYGIFVYANGGSGNIINCPGTIGTAGAGGSGGGGGAGGSAGGGGTGGSTSNGCEMGSGGNGGSGGAGQQGGTGGAGQAGQSTNVSFVSGTGLVTNTVSAYTNTYNNVTVNSYGGAVNSEITITWGNSGTMSLPTGAQWINDVNSTTSSYSSGTVSTGSKIYFPTGTSAGLYDFVVSGVTYKKFIDLTATARTLPTGITFSPNSTGVFCAGATVTMTVQSPTSGATYDWEIIRLSDNSVIASTTGGQLGSGTSVSYTFASNATTGSYDVRLREFLTCPGWSKPIYASPNITLITSPSGTPSFAGTFNICPNRTTGTMTISGISSYTSSATTYSWTPPANITVTGGQGTASITYSSNGNVGTTGGFSVVASNTCGSSSTYTSGNITVLTYPNISTVAGTTTICSGGSTTLTASYSGGTPPVTYLWTSSPTSRISGSSSNAAVATTALSSSTIYQLSITDNNGCTNFDITNPLNSTTVTVNQGISAVNISPTTVPSICVTGTATTLNVAETGGGTITGRQWGYRTVSNGTITPISGQNGSSFTPTGAILGAGTWIIVCTSTPTCGSAMVSNEVTVVVNNLPVAGITNVTGTAIITCTNPSISLTGTGGSTYSWSTGATTANISVSSVATYTVTATSNGCTASATVSIQASAYRYQRVTHICGPEGQPGLVFRKLQQERIMLP